MTAENTIAHPKLSNQIWNYIFKVWAAATFIPGLFLVLAAPIFGILTLGGGVVALPFLLLLHPLIQLMYRFKYRPFQIRLALTILFIAMVFLAVCIMEILVLGANDTNIGLSVFAAPVFICGIIAVSYFDLPGPIKAEP